MLHDGDKHAAGQPWALPERRLPAAAAHAAVTVAQRGLWGASGVGGVVWDSGVALAALVARGALPGVGSVAKRAVIELGAGTGAVGLAAAASGARRVVLTDAACATGLLAANAAANARACAGCEVAVVEADSGRAGAVATAAAGCDLVLAADCVYEGNEGDTDGAFVGALDEALHGARVADAVLVFQQRRAGMEGMAERFLARVAREFRVEAPETVLSPEHREAGLSVLWIRPRALPGSC